MLADPVGELHHAFVSLLEQRPATRRIAGVPGDINQTFARLENALDNRAQ